MRHLPLSARRALAGLLLAIAAAAPAAAMQDASAPPAQAAVEGFAGAARLQLRWELLRTVYDAKFPGGRSEARLRLTNGDSKPLPAQGWSLYINWMEGVETGALAGGLVIEHVAGGLYRLRPGPDFRGVAPGEGLDIVYHHPNPVIKLSKAPAGPYLVYDAAPEHGVTVADFQLLPVVRAISWMPAFSCEVTQT